MRSWRSHVKENSTATIYENASSISTPCCLSDFVRPRRLGTYFTNISLVHYNRKMTAKTVAVESRIDTCRSAGPAGAVRRYVVPCFHPTTGVDTKHGSGSLHASIIASQVLWLEEACGSRERQFIFTSVDGSTSMKAKYHPLTSVPTDLMQVATNSINFRLSLG